jgi:4-amino-4-deoxychorismate lyase
LKLLETLRFENGEFGNLDLHQQRMDASLRAYFNTVPAIKLKEELYRRIQNNPVANKGINKCRVVYGNSIDGVTFSPYTFPDIKSLKLIQNDTIDYSYKFQDRSALNDLFGQRKHCDDILIIKNNLVTDTSYANVLFYDGILWYTPVSPLLPGTQRAFLIKQGRIRETEIRVSDIRRFKKARLVNAMIRFEDELDIDINKIEA